MIPEWRSKGKSGADAPILSGEVFTAKTVLRGNPAGSIAPVGRAALGISTLSRQRGGVAAPENGACSGEAANLPRPQRTERAGPKGQTFHGHRGGGRGQRRSRRATDGARSGSRLSLRLCGSHFPRTVLQTRPGEQKTENRTPLRSGGRSRNPSVQASELPNFYWGISRRRRFPRDSGRVGLGRGRPS